MLDAFRLIFLVKKYFVVCSPYGLKNISKVKYELIKIGTPECGVFFRGQKPVLARYWEQRQQKIFFSSRKRKNICGNSQTAYPGDIKDWSPVLKV